MKKLLPAYIISFVLSFMLYIFEPITMYLTNVDDFWFDLTVIIKPLLIYSVCLFGGISVIFTLIFFLNKLFKKVKVFEVCTLILFVVFICTYIQGNYLAGNLPSLDGTAPDWSQYTTQNIISIVLWLVAIAAVVFTSIKFKVENVVKTSMYISLAVFAMLGVSLLTTFMQANTQAKETPIAVTMKNYNHASTNKNFFILLLDAQDSVIFENIWNSDPDYKDTFNDFTYYKDTMSAYAFTRDSIPFILTGEWNENKDDFRTYATNAMNNSPLLNKLGELGYERNLYESELTWEDEKSTSMDNIIPLDKEIDVVKYFKNQTKYLLFKYLPYPLKKYSRIESMNYNDCKKVEDLFKWDNDYNYARIKEFGIEKQDKNVFNFIHLEGAHAPRYYNKNVENTGVDNYHDSTLASLTIADTYINKLKEFGVYDNSVIIVMADHGFACPPVKGAEGRQNPILLIKGINEHHDKVVKSTLPISYADLNTAYANLLDGKKGESVFGNIDKNRERRYLYYEYSKEDHMTEYVQKGKAWDKKTLVKTGKEFNR